ncbi:nucleotide exchange factor GrpE [Natronomonas gomsonensis]|uniref:nucleotide exchange factor GrpE n=1 Tax=Natronomonas gomsonensis TaxID=1046043 RepID=UPI0020CA93A2|nr:nucleotide exchange factor GrpE [Natronomonas gomsonensis]MCY4731483.1 nucleotide exchange factor GrpE [Natronomonas gomsonensis]
MSDTEREESADGDGQALDAEEPTAEADAAEFVDEETADVDAIAERIADTDTEEIAEEIAALRERNDELELERDDLESRLKRKQAEFQNYKKRQEKRREQERARATEDLVTRLLEVRDNLKRALEQDDDADIREGVEATFRQLDETLASENVDPIEPDPGSEVDPQRHEVLLKVGSDQPAGTVDSVQRPGYEMAGKVLRAAQVTVAEEGE